MIKTHVPQTDPRAREAGMALVLAIMALMLLTFLGLTLAATTSTELQIATNYRWSEQARYNAEAGVEAGKVILIPALSPRGPWSPTTGACLCGIGRTRAATTAAETWATE